MAENGHISFKIERFSTCNENYRSSETLKIGKHEWSITYAIETKDSQKWLGTYWHCNPFVKEPTWTAQVKISFWLEKQGQKIKEWECKSPDLNASKASWGCPKLIAQSMIPKECIVDDSLTVQAEIQVLKESCPTFLFGSPNHSEVVSHEEVMQEQDPAKLFNNELFADVIFVVGNKKEEQTKIFGHRAIIAVSSPVFSTMLFPKKSDCLATKRDEEDRLLIEIQDPETHPTALLSLFRFIYKKEVVVDRNLIHETLYVAEKYDAKKFVESLAFLLTSETILDFLPFVITIGKGHLLHNRCDWIIGSQIKQILNSDSFLTVDDTGMKHILSSDLLQVRELDLFNGYVKWADHQCKEQEISVNDQNRKQVMKHLKLIRFPIMTLEEFASGPAGTDILTGDEKADVFRYMAIKADTKFSSKLRNF